MNQLTLFTQPPPVVVAPDTRKQAHDKVKPSKQALREMIVKALYTSEMTADEWAAANGVSILNARPRFTELKKAGMLWHHGYGLTADGNKQMRFTIYPYIKNRMQLLSCRYGIDKAVKEILRAFNL